MFLKHIRLQNFKCLADIELSFEKADGSYRPWTLILGENGTGKSNVLKAIALVTAGSNALGELLGSTDAWIRNGEDHCQIDATFGDESGMVRPVRLLIHRGASLRSLMEYNYESIQFFDETEAGRSTIVTAYGATRRLSNDPFSSHEKQSRYGGRSANLRSLFDSSASLNSLPAWVMELDYRSDGQALATIGGILSDFLPGIDFHGIDKQKKQVLFKTVDGIVPFEHLSDGYQNMAAWIGDLLYRITETFHNHENPLDTHGILLIDELDLHLHPKWQRKLIDFVTRKLPHFQVIATTHSPLTAQQADEYELFALKRNDENVVEVIPFVGSPKRLLVNQLLMTPVFGLETDESLEVEQAKAEYDRLKHHENSSNQSQQAALQAAKERVKEVLPKRESPSMSEKEIELLEKIEAKLNAK